MRRLFKNKVRYAICAVMVLAMLCPSMGASAMKGNKDNKDTKKQDIITIASNNEQFSTLTQALKAAGLEDTLKGAGPYTVFAPTNEAFAKLPSGTVEELLKPESKDQLVNILTYHVFPGKVTSKDAAKLVGKDVTMLNNQNVKITEKDGDLYINDAKIIIKDIMAKNGVIHVIDTVLIPEK